MIAKYQRQSNLGALIFFVSLGALLMSVTPLDEAGNIWQGNNLGAQASYITMAIAWFYALWAYAKAKGRSGLWVLAGLFTLPGLIALLLLRDWHAHPPEEEDVYGSQGGRHAGSVWEDRNPRE